VRELRVLPGGELSLTFISSLATAQFKYPGAGIILTNGSSYEVSDVDYYNGLLGVYLENQFDVGKKWNLVPGLAFYLPNKESESQTNFMALNLDLHYVSNPNRKTNVYLFGGAHVAGWWIKDEYYSVLLGQRDINELKISPALNAGAGVRFPIAYKVKFDIRAKLIVGMHTQIVANAGVLFNLSDR